MTVQHHKILLGLSKVATNRQKIQNNSTHYTSTVLCKTKILPQSDFDIKSPTKLC